MNDNQNADAAQETIPSTSFGEFAPPPAMQLATSDREIVRLTERAVRGTWLIPPEEFAELPRRLIEIAQGSNTRTGLKAMKLLLEMNGQNGPAPQADNYGSVVVYIPDNGRGGVM